MAADGARLCLRHWRRPADKTKLSGIIKLDEEAPARRAVTLDRQ